MKKIIFSAALAMSFLIFSAGQVSAQSDAKADAHKPSVELNANKKAPKGKAACCAHSQASCGDKANKSASAQARNKRKATAENRSKKREKTNREN